MIEVLALVASVVLGTVGYMVRLTWQMASVHARVEGLEKRGDERLEAIEKRVGDRFEEMVVHLERIEHQGNELRTDVKKIEQRLWART